MLNRGLVKVTRIDFLPSEMASVVSDLLDQTHHRFSKKHFIIIYYRGSNTNIKYLEVEFAKYDISVSLACLGWGCTYSNNLNISKPGFYCLILLFEFSCFCSVLLGPGTTILVCTVHDPLKPSRGSDAWIIGPVGSSEYSFILMGLW